MDNHLAVAKVLRDNDINFIPRLRRYTKAMIIKQQTIGPACPDCIEDTMADNYVLLAVPLNRIKVDDCKYPHITRDNWVELHGYGNDDNNGLDVIDYLIKRYEADLEVYPIVLDANMEILDGLHRYVAAYTIGRDTINAYFPLV